MMGDNTLPKQLNDSAIKFLKNTIRDEFTIEYIKLSEGTNSKHKGTIIELLTRTGITLITKKDENNFYMHYLGCDVIVHLYKK